TAFSMSILDGITSNPPYLCDLRALTIASFNLDNVTRSSGDFAPGSLASEMERQHTPETIVRAVKEHAADRKSLVFLPTLSIAEAVTWEFQASGMQAAIVTDSTPREERKALVSAMRLGKLDVLCNCMVLTEGFDAPVVDCIVLGRVTQSRGLFTQMVGRGTR